MNRNAPVDIEQVHAVLQHDYLAAAADPVAFTHHRIGRDLAEVVGYRVDWLRTVPPDAIDSFFGTGNPFLATRPEPGDRVVDVGCGAGFDLFVAASFAGPAGQLIGVDLTEAMLAKTRRLIAEHGPSTITVRTGQAEALPVDDGWADLVIANGLLNLVPEKRQALAEMHRVLRPGGTLAAGEMAVEIAVPDEAKADPEFWKR